MVQGRKEIWDEYVDACIYAYNTAVHESTKYSPFELMFGRKAILPIDINVDENEPSQLINQSSDVTTTSVIQTITEQRLERIQLARDNIRVAQERQKELYDRKHAHPCAFTVGDKVLMKDITRKKRKGGKMDVKFLGPYTITKKFGKGIYSFVSDENVVEKVSRAYLKPYMECKNDQPLEEFVSAYICMTMSTQTNIRIQETLTKSSFFNVP
jgi:hypothetical protein